MEGQRSEFILKIEEIPVLLNLLYLRENTFFRLYPYLIDKNIFEIRLDKQVMVRLLLKLDQYEKILRKRKLDQFPEIVPKYSIIRSILIGSGFLKMSNWSELVKIFEDIKNIDPLKGQRYTFIGMDTNCYINRIYSIMNHLYGKDIFKFYFVLSRLIQRELLSTYKIRNEKLNDLKNKFNENQKIFDEFWNGEILKTRTRHIGLVEFNKLRRKSKNLINDALEIHEGKDNDLQILEDFRNQILKQHYNVLLLSSDKQLADQSRQPGIIGFYLENPSLEQIPERLNGTWHMFCDFLYLSSIYFGAVGLRGNQNTIQMFGLWKGKKPEDWDTESIKVRVGSEIISSQLDKQLQILKSE